MDRKELLQVLIEGREPTAELLDRLNAFGWDCAEPLVTLTAQEIAAVLQQYLAGDIEPSTVHEWADVIHVREDIGLDRPHEQMLREVLHELANPYLTQELTFSTAQAMLNKLAKLRE